jgi:DNA-binding transcriptional regulator YhcF (GntR family)
MYQFRFNHNDKLSKVKQIVRSIAMDIEKGVLEKDYHLPSINEFSEQYSIARDTVEKAYKELKEQGYIVSVASRGYYVAGKKDQRLKILLVFNKLSSYKKIIYDSLLAAFGDKAKVDLQIHHYNPGILKEIIDNNLGHYHYYVIMPHFFADSDEEQYMKVIKMIPEKELLLLDKNLPALGTKCMAVFQDFRQDIYNALESAVDLLQKYNRLIIVFPTLSNHPIEIIEGTMQFCVKHQKDFSVIASIQDEVLQAGTVYIAIAESDLALMIKKVRASEYSLGKEIGVISFNETVLKELLDITVITTDFEGMGRSAACLILNREYAQIKNPFFMIRRQSL